MQQKNTLKRRMKPLFAICMCGILITVCLHLPQVVYAAERVFPTATAEGAETSGEVTDSAYIRTSGGVVDSGDVSENPTEEESDFPYEEEEDPIQPSMPSAPPVTQTKQPNQVIVSMEDFIYGGRAPLPQVSVQNGDVSAVTLLYKVAGASDAAYQTEMPTEVGTYTVQAILPETEQYYKATATDTYSIRYLESPQNCYNWEAEGGNFIWWITDFVITPPEGYQMSIGSRDHFGTQSYTLTEENNSCVLYLRKISTGEMTDAIPISQEIDTHAPVIGNLTDGNTYYGDTVEIKVTESNPCKIYVNGSVVQECDVADETAVRTVVINTGVKKETYVIAVQDEAGNKTEISAYLAPAWMEAGIVGVGEYYLQTGEKYSLPEGADWTIDGDATVYSGGVSFYSTTEGMHTFAKE